MKHIRGTRSAGLFTIVERRDISVGMYLFSSSLIVSQLKFFTASTVSRRMESLSLELRVFISDLIFDAILVITVFDQTGVLARLDASPRYDLRESCLMDIFLDGVRMINFHCPFG